MKRIKYLSFIFCVFLLSSCGNDAVVDNNQSSNIAGRWVWVESVGGFTGHDVMTPAKTGVTKSITFVSAAKCILTENGKIVQQANYIFGKYSDSDYLGVYGYLNINYSDTNRLASKYYVNSLSNAKLVLSDFGCDGYTHTYIKSY
jgi:hypothetical protein